MVIFFTILFSITFTHQSDAEVLTFQEWKSFQIHLAENNLKNIEQVNPSSLNEEMKRRVQIGVEASKSLELKDYWSIYASELTQKDLTEVVKKMLPEEITELFIYIKKDSQDLKKAKSCSHRVSSIIKISQ